MSAAREATDASLDDATVAKMQQTFVGGAGRHAAAAELEPTQERLELSATSVASIASASAAVRSAKADKRGKGMAIPTDPKRVQLMLREIGDPICFFGEKPAQRRRRLTLRMGELLLSIEEGDPITAKQHAALSAALESGEESLRAAVRAAKSSGTGASLSAGAASSSASSSSAGGEDAAASVYTRASAALVSARQAIGSESVRRAAARLQSHKALLADAGAIRQRDIAAATAVYAARGMSVSLSQIADTRPLAACAVSQTLDWAGIAPASPSSSSSSSSSSPVAAASHSGVVATGSWGGSVRLFGLSTLEPLRTLRGHTQRVTSADFRRGMPLPALMPVRAGASSASSSAASAADVDADGDVDGESGTAPADPGTVVLATGACDMTILLWGSASDTPIAALKGHQHRLGRVAWHPHSRHIGSTSFDTTWRLWDVETAEELLLQDGHGAETFSIAFHPDGSLVAVGDLSGIGRVWDLRTGRAVTTLRGHAKQLVALDFSPDGHTLASGSEDHSVMVWDLRARRPLTTLPAHTSLVSGVRFAPTTGEYLATCSFDGTIRTWGTRDFRLISSLGGHAGRVMDLAVCDDETSIVSCGWDRTVKVWV